MREPGPFFFGLVAVAGIVFAGLSVAEVVAEDRLRGVLDARGQVTTGVVMEVQERDRAGLPMSVEVVLPDRRRAEVQFVSSDDDLEIARAEVGEKVELVVDPLDPDQNLVVADYGRWWSGTVVESLDFRTLVPAGAAVVACVLALRARRRRRPAQSVAQT
ncbi:DUF3592 domain-containing protein [Kribbella sp. VKM Ac-2568]|uniref:DUF3592 domain-containing protein n=1 Tax=Kribbella sp. VKM Ac-2568 TaxID=2512219 RepID=UPI0010518EE9|nr:DUF3592 domain-containing protein [Kribbella sp. VKM Ac-2568]TCM47765.1 hypothetical protein EV648_104158 [Kribbella sp. VKM Ac-2568]